jgi:glucose-6-phosphate isomerase
LVHAEQRATSAAHAARGRPSCTLTVDAVDPWHIGAILMWLQCATVYASGVYDVNPLDQPGVELGKRYIGAQFGRPGMDAEKKEFDAMASSEGIVVIG